MSYGIVYYWHCVKTNKGYVGQTVNTLKNRWSGHVGSAFKETSKSYYWEFPKAIREHGVNAFEGQVICECDSAEELSMMEYHYMKEFNTLWPHGYNMRAGRQYTHEQTRKLMSQAKLGKPLSEKHKQKISDGNKGHLGAMLGKNHSIDTKQKISASSRGHKKPKRTKEHAQNLSESLKGNVAWNKGLSSECQPMFGKRHSEETKAKMRQHRSEETKQKMRIEQRRRVLTKHADVVDLLTKNVSIEEIIFLTGKDKKMIKRVFVRLQEHNEQD